MTQIDSNMGKRPLGEPKNDTRITRIDPQMAQRAQPHLEKNKTPNKPPKKSKLTQIDSNMGKRPSGGPINDTRITRIDPQMAQREQPHLKIIKTPNKPPKKSRLTQIDSNMGKTPSEKPKNDTRMTRIDPQMAKWA